MGRSERTHFQGKMELLYFCLNLFSLCYLASGVQRSTKYTGHKVLRVYPESQQHVRELQELARRSENQVQSLDDATEGRVPRIMDLLLSSPEIYHILEGLLRQHHVVYDVMSHDLQQDIDRHASENANARASLPYFSSFHPLEEIFSFMAELASRCGDRCEIFEIGQSYEGRPLRGLKISGAGPGENKRKLWIDAGIHAREWISHATAQFLMERLVDDYTSDPDTRLIVDSYDWYILPCVNPDGYNFTWETDRLWRKTRRPNPATSCVGTDANRNFNFKWGVIGTSSDPCANNYQGPWPFSEPEASAMADYVNQHPGMWDMFISLHSKGQLIMAPWGYKYGVTEDFSDLERVGLAMTEAISATHGENYTFGAASSVLYQSSGTSRDWARGAANIKYVYTIELRDRGQYGWMLPPDQILPTGQEIWAAMKAAVNTMMAEPTE